MTKMTRYEAIERSLRQAIDWRGFSNEELNNARAAIALPEDGKTVNAELYGLAVKLSDMAAFSVITAHCPYWGLDGTYGAHATYPEAVKSVQEALRYLELRAASGDPMPYKDVRDGDKVRFE